MIEWLKHLLGICGEPHGLLYWLFTTSGLSIYLIKRKRGERDDSY